ncbi:hypothetical protein R3I94_023278, partial [Phoxinus phoxinus]
MELGIGFTADPNQDCDTNTVSRSRADPDPSHKRRRFPTWLIGLIVLIIIFISAGSACVIWYFLEYRVWVLEPRVIQQYTASVSILNKNFSVSLTSHESSEFRAEATSVQNM